MFFLIVHFLELASWSQLSSLHRGSSVTSIKRWKPISMLIDHHSCVFHLSTSFITLHNPMPALMNSLNSCFHLKSWIRWITADTGRERFPGASSCFSFFFFSFLSFFFFFFAGCTSQRSIIEALDITVNINAPSFPLRECVDKRLWGT